MRELKFDLSADSYLPQSEFAGFEGEHNATRVILLLPERLQVEGAEFYMVFELLKSKETIFSAPLIPESGAIMLDLPKQLMVSPGTSVYAAVYQRVGEDLLQIAKTGKVFLEIKEPEDGVLVAYSAQGGSAPGLVIESEIKAKSTNPVSSDAICRALEKLVSKEEMKGETERIDEEFSKQGIQIRFLESEKVRLEGDISALRGEKELLSAKTQELSEKIESQKNALLANALNGYVKGGTALQIDDISEAEEEISVKLSDGYRLVQIYENSPSEISEKGCYTVTGILSPELGDDRWEFSVEGGVFLIYPEAKNVYETAKLVQVGDQLLHDPKTGNGFWMQKVSDLSAAKLWKYGKNIFNRSKTVCAKGYLNFFETKQTFLSIDGGGDLNTVLGKYKDFSGKTITISYDFVDYQGENPSFATMLKVGDKVLNIDGKDASFYKAYKEGGVKVSATYTIPENDSEEDLILRQYVGYITKNAGDFVTLDHLQVEIGTCVTDFEEYRKPILYIPSENGEVKIPVSSSMTTLMTDLSLGSIEVQKGYE